MKITFFIFACGIVSIWATSASLNVREKPQDFSNQNLRISKVSPNFWRNVESQQAQTKSEGRSGRQPRGVNLSSLRKLVNNVAMSEYYRIRGLETLNTLGILNTRPKETMLTSASSTVPQQSQESPNRSKIFQRLYDIYRKDKTIHNIFDYLGDGSE